MLIKYKPGQRYIQEKFCRCGQITHNILKNIVINCRLPHNQQMNIGEGTLNVNMLDYDKTMWLYHIIGKILNGF